MLDGHWLVVGIDVDGELVPPVAGSRLTMTIEGEGISGSSGVNRFFGKIEGENFVEPLGTTMMWGPTDLMSQEERFLSYLTPQSSLWVEGGTLQVRANGRTVVKMVPTDPENEDSTERI